MVRKVICLLGIFLLLGCWLGESAAQEQIVGVGIMIEPQKDGTVFIKSLVAGGPAERAGIKADDELLAVDGRSVADIEINALTTAIRGREGTQVTLTVRTKGEKPRKLTIRRAAIAMPAQGPQPSDSPSGRTAGKPKPSPSSVQPGNIQEVMKFRRVSVTDPGINNIEAVSFLIPADWKTEGGIQWFPDYSILANLLMRITDPKTGAAIEFLPVQNFTWLTQMVVPMQPGTNYLGNILWQPIAEVPSFIQTFYMPQTLSHLQGGRMVANEDLPKVAAEVAREFGGLSKVRSARVRYQFQSSGRMWEEDIYCTLVYTPWQMGTLWSVHSAYSFRAPGGQLDAISPVMNTTIRTLRLSPEWYGGYMYVQKLFQDRMNQSIRNARAISETITRNSEEIRRMFSDSYRQRQESQDRINQSFSEYIRGVDTYKNPYENRPVQLPNGYQDAWVNGRGEYILSNSSGFNPNVGDTTEWRRMERERR